MPPLPGQHAITAFLDRRTARIDALTNVTNAEWDVYKTTVHPWELDRYLAAY
ncbi:hypothetical protein [Methanoculleus sp. 7T]|uniref:hypothetical protein n=1 Tax=Methanoculleus sp. 7T TaxID=2937282 RepID=UPI0020C01916|nr:hypothetical protein [Methanoculleus sp. 7T]MCK8518115.1 hypothetical protein [Methanoculleus sp. 7T]